MTVNAMKYYVFKIRNISILTLVLILINIVRVTISNDSFHENIFKFSLIEDNNILRVMLGVFHKNLEVIEKKLNVTLSPTYKPEFKCFTTTFVLPLVTLTISFIFLLLSPGLILSGLYPQ